MSFWEKLFSSKTENNDVAAAELIRLGRYTDTYKSPEQYAAWDEALTHYENEKYLDSYRAFFRYLRNTVEDNVRWSEEPTGIAFEILQGSKRISGFASAQSVTAEARVATAKSLSVAFMRRLMEVNYNLNFCRFGLDDDNNLVIKFHTYALDGSPYKLYYALKELSISADKHDDLLLDEFLDFLQPIDTGAARWLTGQEADVKAAFVHQKIQKTLNEIDNGSLDSEQYPMAVSTLLLDALYTIDFLITPHGFIQETTERCIALYFRNDGKDLAQKNAAIRTQMEQILNRTKERISRELYDSSYTFGVLEARNHEVLVNFIDGELSKMNWYETNGHQAVALSTAHYIVGTLLFKYALPAPDRAYLALYYKIFESAYFKDLGIPPQYLDTEIVKFDQKAIKNAIKSIAEKHISRYPNVSFKTENLKFDTAVAFARSYLETLKSLDLTEKK